MHTMHTDQPEVTLPLSTLSRPGIKGRGYGYGPRMIRRLAQGQTGGPYEHFELKQTGPLIGAEVIGIDFTKPIEPEVFGELEKAFYEWKVLFFRDCDISPVQQRSFASLFGAIDGHPFIPKGTSHDVLRLEKGGDSAGLENVWHHDFPWTPTPPLGAVLRMVELPEVGGDTLFCDTAAAYDNLPVEIQAKLSGLRAVHSFAPSGNYRDVLTDDQHAHFEVEFPPVEHPLVRTHPKTGRNTLFATSIFTTHIAGLLEEESEELLEYLFRQMQHPEYQFRFRWESNSMIMWDNQAVMHYACSDYFPRRRVVDRVAIAGDRPI